jgi:hypothetical protein
MKNITFYILTTHKHKLRHDWIIKTWGSDVDYKFYSDREDINTIKVTDDDSYQSAEEKQINMINHLIDHIDDIQSEWVMFCDNDTYVNTHNLQEIIDTLNPEEVHGKILSEKTDPCNAIFKRYPGLEYLSGGAGFIMSKTLIRKMKRVSKHNTGYSDVCLGINLYEQGIKIHNISGFNTDNETTTTNIESQITHHYIKTEEQFMFLHNYRRICDNTYNTTILSEI